MHWGGGFSIFFQVHIAYDFCQNLQNECEMCAFWEARTRETQRNYVNMCSNHTANPTPVYNSL